MARAIVAGHLCLDLIPSIDRPIDYVPGSLIEVGPVTMSTGGVVSNTGRALDRLGIDTRLVARIGRDLFGDAVATLLGPLADGLMRVDGQATSYTVVLSGPGEDRVFFHHPGANRTFSAADVDLREADLLHFGYPPLLESMYADDGEQIVELFRGAKNRGLTTSLDLSLPDPESPSGQVDWRRVLERVLPLTDIFVPSLPEMEFMLGQSADPAQTAIDLGAKVALLKLGRDGVHLRTAPRIEHAGRALEENCRLIEWHDRTVDRPAFPVTVVGTTGAGDAAAAGFLAAVMRGLDPIEATRIAATVAASSCEAPDATSGVLDWESTVARFA